MDKEQKESLMTPEEACTYLEIKRQTLYNWITKRRIPYIKLNGGGRLRFRRGDIDEWLNKDKVKQFKVKSRPIFGTDWNKLGCSIYTSGVYSS